MNPSQHLRNKAGPDPKLHDYLTLFDQVAHDVEKPFVIVINGINEVNDLTSFNEELKAFCSAVSQYEWIKLVITCRSEFFDERFATILDEPFAVHIHRVNDLRSEMTNQSKSRLLNAYWRCCRTLAVKDSRQESMRLAGR